MGLPFNRIANPLLYGFDCAASFLYGFDGATLLLFFAGGDFILAGIISIGITFTGRLYKFYDTL